MASAAIRRALVTGATGGIGGAFVRQLAARGVDLVVCARGAGRLEDLASAVRDGYGVAAEALAGDLLEAAGREAVEQRLAGGEDPVDLLVNCAGVGARGGFHELPRDRQDDLVRLHTGVVAGLTRAALPRMVAAGRGGVITVSSLAGFAPAPWSAVYGAAKSFQTAFMEAVHEELHGTGVRATVLCPGYVPTGFDQVAGIDRPALPAVLTGDPDAVAAAGLRAFTHGRALCVPGSLGGVLAAAARLAPAALGRRVSAGIRRRL